MTVAVSFSNQMDKITRLYATRKSRAGTNGFLRPNQVLYKDKVLRLTRLVTRGYDSAQEAVFTQLSEVVAKRLGGKLESFSVSTREVVVSGDIATMGEKLSKLHPSRIGGWLYCIPINENNRFNWCATLRHEMFSAAPERHSGGESFSLKEMLNDGDIRLIMKDPSIEGGKIVTHTWQSV